MRYPLTVSLLLLITALAPAAPPEVKFPELAAPTPAPVTPKPATPVATVTTDRLFVVESKTKVALKGSTLAGKVDIKAVPGPFTVYAKFADGPDKMDLKTFAGPYVFLVIPVETGDCELFVVPDKWESADDIQTRKIRVEKGEGPRPPPPHVDPTVDPTVKPPFDSPDGLRVMIVYDEKATNLPAAQLQALNSQKVYDWLNANTPTGSDGKTHEWRRYPHTSDVSRDKATWQAAFKAAGTVSKTPKIVIANAKTGFVGDLPGTEAAVIELLEKYK